MESDHKIQSVVFLNQVRSLWHQPLVQLFLPKLAQIELSFLIRE